MSTLICPDSSCPYALLQVKHRARKLNVHHLGHPGSASDDGVFNLATVTCYRWSPESDLSRLYSIGSRSPYQSPQGYRHTHAR